jgi:hypothetical protein
VGNHRVGSVDIPLHLGYNLTVFAWWLIADFVSAALAQIETDKAAQSERISVALRYK